MKKKFTWLDGVLLAVLAIVIAVGAFLILKPSSKGEDEVATKDYLVTMRFNRVTTVENDGYQVGDTLYFQNRTDTMGTIQSIKTIDLQSERYDTKTGEFVVVTEPERKGVELTVLVEGSLDEGRFEVAEEELYIGKLFYPQSDTTRSGMTVWNIEEVAEK